MKLKAMSKKTENRHDMRATFVKCVDDRMLLSGIRYAKPQKHAPPILLQTALVRVTPRTAGLHLRTGETVQFRAGIKQNKYEYCLERPARFKRVL